MILCAALTELTILCVEWDYSIFARLGIALATWLYIYLRVIYSIDLNYVIESFKNKLINDKGD